MRAASASVVLLAAVLVAAIACGGAQPKSASMAPSPQAADPGSAHADARAEIESLEREIASDMLRAHVDQPPVTTCSGASCAIAMSEPFGAATRIDAQCRPATTQRCNDTCTLSTSICRNQARICDLAKHLSGDDWAANKCESARASCKAAHESCCSCVG